MSWYYLQDGKVEGPVPEKALGQLLADRIVSNSTLLCKEGSQDWIPLQKCLLTFQSTKRPKRLTGKAKLSIASTLLIGLTFGIWLIISRADPPQTEDPSVATPKQSDPALPKQEKATASQLFFEGLKHYVGGLDNVPINYGKAASLFDQAARLGHPPSQFHLGQCYLEGRGVEHDIEKFALWTLRSAEAGHAPAQKSAVAIFLHGMGAEQDRVRAYMWANLAASSRHQDIVPEAKSLREKITRLLTTDQLNKAQKLSSSWQPSPPYKE